MYKYAETKNRAHRVHVDGGKAFKVEECNLDDAKYFGLLEEPPNKEHCKHCFRPPTVEEEAEKAEKQVPAIAKKDIPKSLLVVPRRLLALLILFVATFALLGGSASGVVLSPDPRATPSPAIDWEFIYNHTHAPDHTHLPEVTPSPIPSSTTTSTPNPIPTGAEPTQSRTTVPASTARPSRSPSPTSTAAPVASTSPGPSPTCYRPGEAVGNPDPCQYPHQP